MKRQLWIDRIRSAEREYKAAVAAAEALDEVWRGAPGRFLGEFADADKVNFKRNLQATYFLRIFAVFEQALRDIWAKNLRRKTRPATEQLIDRIAARLHIYQDVVDKVHKAREYRNGLIHEESETVSVSLDQARSCLCQYVSYIPNHW
jgi:hypothetical protein